MDKIYEQAKDLHVVGTMVYGKTDETSSGEGYAYADKDCTVKLSKDELYEAFVKGCFVYLSETLYKPFFAGVDGTDTFSFICIGDPKELAISEEDTEEIIAPLYLNSSEYTPED